jgi:hypothetical protein
VTDHRKAIERTLRCSLTTGDDTESEEYSSSSDESDTAQEGLRTAGETKLCKTVNLILEDIRSLYRISVLLRRPQLSSRYLRLSNSTIASREALEASADYAHVSDCLRRWRKSAMRPKFIRYTKSVVTEEAFHLRRQNEYQEIADIAFFCQRLTWANILRRKQLDHWINCPDVPESQEKALDAVSKPNQLERQTPSAIHTSLSTVTKSASGNDNYVGQSPPVYTQSMEGHLHATRVPDVPKCSKTDPSFECPICHLILDSKKMQSKKTWK